MGSAFGSAGCCPTSVPAGCVPLSSALPLSSAFVGVSAAFSVDFSAALSAGFCAAVGASLVAGSVCAAALAGARPAARLVSVVCTVLAIDSSVVCVAASEPMGGSGGIGGMIQPKK